MAAFRTRTHPRAAVLGAAIASLVLAVVSFGVPERSSPPASPRAVNAGSEIFTGAAHARTTAHLVPAAVRSD